MPKNPNDELTRQSVDSIARKLPGRREDNRKCIVAFCNWCAAELYAGRDLPLYNIGKLKIVWRSPRWNSGGNGWAVKFKPSTPFTSRLKESLKDATPQLKHLSSGARAYLHGSKPAWKFDPARHNPVAQAGANGGSGESSVPHDTGGSVQQLPGT